MFESLKGFEIRSVQEKELLVNKSANINSINTVICPKLSQRILQPMYIV
jgi:hypothetical protein